VAASNSSDEAAMAVSQLEMAELPLQLDGAGDDVDTDTEADDPSHEHQASIFYWPCANCYCFFTVSLWFVFV
jgi:hypothetical protein